MQIPQKTKISPKSEISEKGSLACPNIELIVTMTKYAINPQPILSGLQRCVKNK